MKAERFGAWLTPAPSLTFPGQLLRRVSAWPLAGWALGGGLLALAGLRLALLSDAQAPPGSDGGNWLAFARELFGEEIKAADVAYPPVAPLLLRLLMLPLGALGAVKVLAVASSILMGVPLYLILRRELHPVLSVALALAFVMAGYQAETLAFGGYPQLLGAAFLLFSLYWLGPTLLDGRTWPLLLSAMAGSLAIGTHLLGATQLIVAAPILAGCFAFQQRAAWRRVAARFARWSIVTAALALTVAPFYVRLLPLLDGSPANPQGYGITALRSTLSYVYLEHQALWMVLTGVALVVPLVMVGRRSDSLLAPTAAALLFGPLLVFAASGEVRSFQLLEAGVLVSLGLLTSYVVAGLATRGAGQRWPGWPALAVGAACLAIAGAIGVSGHSRAQDSFAFYRVVDDEAVEALDWLRLQEEGTVVASIAPQGAMYGWWIEGYAGHPAYSAADPRWFNFREEKKDVAVANRLLSARLRPREAARLVDEHDIRYVFLDKRAPTDWLSLEAAGFRPAYQSAHYMVLRWEPARAGRAVGK